MKKYLVGALMIGEPGCSHRLTRRLIVAVLSLVTAGLFSSCGGTLRGVGAHSGPTATPTVTLSVQSLSFNSQTDSFQDLTLSNSGNAVLNISGITISPDFREDDDCIPTVAPGASCVIGVTFAPWTTGTFTGTLSISDNTPGAFKRCHSAESAQLATRL